MGIRSNQKIDILDDTEWETMGYFISDFAKSNESITDESLTNKIEFKNPADRNTQLSEKNLKAKSGRDKSTFDSKKAAKGSLPVSGTVEALQSDIRNLLDELNEIKQARINLQSRLNTIRQ